MIDKEDKVKSFVDSLSKDGLARWLTLIYAECIISKFCGNNEDCINEKTNKLQDYIDSRFHDVKRYIELIEQGKTKLTLDEYFVIEEDYYV